MNKNPKRLRNSNQLAKDIVDLATMDEEQKDALEKRIKRDKPIKSTKRQIPGKRGSGG
jgi:hypothetical protein